MERPPSDVSGLQNPNLSVMKSCPGYESTALRGCRGFRNTTVFRYWNLTTQNAFGSGKRDRFKRVESWLPA